MTMVALPANSTTLSSRPLLIPVFEEAVVALYAKTVGPATGACHARGSRMAGLSIPEGQLLAYVGFSSAHSPTACLVDHSEAFISEVSVNPRLVCTPAGTSAAARYGILTGQYLSGR
jgi:hypothetical protein